MAYVHTEDCHIWLLYCGMETSLMARSDAKEPQLGPDPQQMSGCVDNVSALIEEVRLGKNQGLGSSGSV